MTVYNFNKDSEGNIKSEDTIRAELRAELDAWLAKMREEHETAR